MSDSSQPHTGPHLRGGPAKIAGIQKSAADAQAARERFAAGSDNVDNSCSPDSGDRDTGSAEIGSVGESETTTQGAPGHGIHVRGGPQKISAIMKSAQNGKERREAFEQELASKGGQSEDQECDVEGDEDGNQGQEEGRQGPGPKFRGGPAKIQAMMQSKKDAEKRREEAREAAAGENGEEEEC